MTNSEIVEALNNLAPDSEWVLVGDDYETINWIRGIKPTLEEIQTEVNLLPEKRKQALAETQAKKAALLNRLAITEEEARLLLA